MSDPASRQRSAQRLRPRAPGLPRQEPRAPGADPSGGSGASPSDTGSGGKSGNRFVRYAVGLAAAVAIGAGAYFGMQGGAADQVSTQERQTLQQQYTAMVAAGGLEVEMVSADEVDQAVASMPVSAEQRTEVHQKVQSGHMRLAWLTLWDTHAQDGDVLRIESDASLPVEVTALNNPTTLAIPFPASGMVKVTGVVDGGGGITIGLKSGAAQITWPTMQPGDALNLPVTPGL